MIYPNSKKGFGLAGTMAVALVCLLSHNCMAKREEPYLQRLASFQTNLLRKGRAPNSTKELTPKNGFRAVSYQSGKLKLKAWVSVPPNARSKRLPAIVHFHGGFGVANGHFHTCKPFQRAGFVVMLPALRGESGNPGTFEMFLSEVDDAKAAVRWLQKQRFVDPRRMYAFGHSAGGVISGLLSLHDDVPIRHSGSCGGIYPVTIFDALASRVPFDKDDHVERALRVLPGNVRWMKRPHYAYVGDADRGVFPGMNVAKHEIGQIEASGKKPMLQIEMVSGAHSKSLEPAMNAYLKQIKSESGGR